MNNKSTLSDHKNTIGEHEKQLLASFRYAIIQIINDHESGCIDLTSDQLRQLTTIGNSLSPTAVDSFLKQYDYQTKANTYGKNVAIIMAGNLPLVGFMDLIYVLLSGNNPVCKLSSKDDKLIPMIIKKAKIDNISIVDSLPINLHALIATGSNNTARYFNYYHKDTHRIIRKSRTSIAVLSGNETNSELELLADDIMSYSGRGCRNISHLLIPQNYKFKALLEAIKDYPSPLEDPNYADNYKIQKAIFTTTKRHHIDTGVSIMYENQQLGTPIATIKYHYYEDTKQIEQYLNENANKLQCFISNSLPNAIPFGNAQIPTLSEYSDNIDIIKWLKELFYAQS